jgi:hypothetical protein
MRNARLCVYTYRVGDQGNIKAKQLNQTPVEGAQSGLGLGFGKINLFPFMTKKQASGKSTADNSITG